MKKIGIITILKVDNYGAELQAFATQYALRKMGYDAEIIDYLFYKHPRYIKTRASKPVFPMPLRIKIIENLYPILELLRDLIHGTGEKRNREQIFENFHKANTCMSREYRSIKELYSSKLDYDVYIVGSDQVWNPNTYTSLDPYFLKFAPEDKIRISYASSIGVSNLPPQTIKYYKDALGHLDSISVREEDAVQIIEKISGRKAKWVVDPTLLIEGAEWVKFSKQVDGLPERFVLMYEPSICPFLKVLALHVAKALNAKVVRLGPGTSSDERLIELRDAGPAEFLWLVRNSVFVVSDSFHGTAFSINMNKNFYMVSLKRRPNASRQRSLLNMVGLLDRLMDEDSILPTKEDLPVNFEMANKKLIIARNNSITYLRDAINGKRR